MGYKVIVQLCKKTKRVKERGGYARRLNARYRRIVLILMAGEPVG